MPLIITPHQLAKRGELYFQLSSLIAAGVSLPRALDTLQRASARSFRGPLQRISQQLEQGHTFSEAVGTIRWLPAFDVALIRAAEQSGRLDACFKLLSNYYGERAQLARTVLSELAYPLFTFHFAILVFPTSLLTRMIWNSDPGPFVRQKLSVFLPLYGAVFLLIFACQGQHGEWWRSWVERLTRMVPVLGAARRSLALSRLAAALEALLNAGVPILDAWELAAAASGSPALRRAVVNWRDQVEHGGQTPAEAMAASSAFPELFCNLYHTGEISGQTDDTLKRLHTFYGEEGERKLRHLARWAPRLAYVGILIWIAYQILLFYTGYFHEIGDAINM